MTTSYGSDLPGSVDLSMARAVLSRFLSLGLQPPAEALAADLATEDRRRALCRAALCLDGEEGRLPAAVEELLDLVSGLRWQEVEDQYQTLFGHTLRGAVCPYEVEYGRRALLQQAQELADLAGFYRAFGLQVVAGARERPDHVVCELEFLGFLARKEAYALAVPDDEMAGVTSAACRRFVGEHVGRFGRAFARNLEDAAGEGFYAALARLCDAFLVVECRRLGVPVGTETLELRAWNPNDAPMACGTACAGQPEAELVQIGSEGGA